MLSYVNVCCAASFVVLVLFASTSALTHRRFEYKHSFKGPHLVQRDGTIPFWEHGGHAIASDESIRITPSLRSKRGHVWAKESTNFANWEIDVQFRISGRGRIGADGLAIWYTKDRAEGGFVFGNADKWNGLAVIFDSFDNDGQQNNPYIGVMLNDGTKMYDHQMDGMNQQLGGCLRDFRNKPFPVRAKIEYYQRTLTVLFHTGMTNHKDDFEMCVRAENVDLPADGYFGVTAATGGLADDHDVQSFLTHSITTVDDSNPTAPQVSEDERKKFESEFDEYWQKLQKAKEDYQLEHPDKKPVDYDDKEWFETQDQKELKMIFDSQNAIHDNIRTLHRKLDEVIGRQERTLSSLSLINTGAGAAHGNNVGAAPQLGLDTIRRHEVDTILNSHRELLAQVRDTRSAVDNVQKGSAGQGGIGNANQHNELKSLLMGITGDVKALHKPQGGAPCPSQESSNCITPWLFFIFIALQMAFFIGYAAYRSNREAAAKKFY